MMKQRHYHLYMLIVSLVLIASGGLLAYGCLNGWRWPALAMCGALCAGAMCIQWRGASFVADQVKYFLGSLHSKDAMSRFPATRDAELLRMYDDMNSIMQKYGQYQMELETRRLYYDRVLRIMTHELRNSITPVVSLSEDMLQREYSADDGREAIELIHEQCNSIVTFLDSYYSLTHQKKPDLEVVDARKMLLHIERLYPEKGISIRCTQGLRILCDEDQIRQILVNLVKNALEAIGETRIAEMCSEGVAPVEVMASMPDGKPRITVSDRGPGIPSGKQEEIFLPFYTTKEGGSGIGLAVSRHIMTLHKGTLTCSTNELGGAVFVLQF